MSHRAANTMTHMLTQRDDLLIKYANVRDKVR